MSLKRFLPYLALAGGLIFVVFAFASRVPANGTGPEAPTPLPIAATSLSPAVQEQAARVGYSRGSQDAPITVIEFSDFGCPFCGMFALETYPDLHREFVETGKVRWHYVPFVMGVFPNGAEAARAAECAAEQGDAAFWAMHDILYARQPEWRANREPAELFGRLASEIEIDADAFATCYRNDSPADRITAANAVARQAGVNATPTFFVNGRRVQGALPLEHFRMILTVQGW